MRLDGTRLYDGYMAEYDLDNDFSVVEVYSVRDVQVGPFQSALESLPHGEVLAVGHDTSGEIMVETVELNGDSKVSEDDRDLHCKVSKVHLHDDMSISFLFLLGMEATEIFDFLFVFNSCSVQLYFVQM